MQRKVLHWFLFCKWSTKIFPMRRFYWLFRHLICHCQQLLWIYNFMQVMEQFFGLVNTFLENHRDTWKRKLRIRTYKVHNWSLKITTSGLCFH